MVLLDSTTAAEESNKEYDASNNDEEYRGGKELVSQEVKILTVGSLDHPASNDEEQSRQLKYQNS